MLAATLLTTTTRIAISDFKQRFSQIELAAVERSRTRLATALCNGVLDVLIVTGSRPLLDINALPLWSERVLAVLPHDHFAARDTVYWTDLRDETVFLSHYDPGKDFF
ncbi:MULTISPECIES: LysR family transcriptional regulator substrate-binding protein [Bradyrhizobium]|uniref:LysR family transcriptional regulator substrate-binding protein n=1 Tax=Bradyrhizobium TaxID=374 RepID=UPI001FDF29A2|nr:MULTISPECIES: LysR family transcriptional regulator substrate-binding protein [Bradyrhizobium]